MSGRTARTAASTESAFETAQLVFDDPLDLSRPDTEENGEERWQTIGVIEGVVVLVAHTYREEDHEEVVRIISARKATKQERRHYEKGKA